MESGELIVVCTLACSQCSTEQPPLKRPANQAYQIGQANLNSYDLPCSTDLSGLWLDLVLTREEQKLVGQLESWRMMLLL